MPGIFPGQIDSKKVTLEGKGAGGEKGWKVEDGHQVSPMGWI